MRGRLVERRRVSPEQHYAMLRLLQQSFEGTSRAGFLRDLQDKNWVILLEDDAGQLAGFTTLHFARETHEGSRISVVCSGDTVVGREHAGSSVLSRTWIDSVLRLHRDTSGGRLYWLLLTSGFRTYRFLPVFWREFFPRHDRAEPEAARRLRDRLAAARYGSLYDPATGIVRFEAPQRLRDTLRGVPSSKLDDPHVAFFCDANPGHADGDELVCLTKIADTNLTPAGRRMVRAGSHDRSLAASP